MNLDDGLGACQPLQQPGIVLLQECHFGGERLGLGCFRAALSSDQRTKRAGIPQPAPVAQGRGVEALATQYGADPAGGCGTIDVSEDAQLVRGGERPAAETGVNSAEAASGAGTTVGLRLAGAPPLDAASMFLKSMGMNEMILAHPQGQTFRGSMSHPCWQRRFGDAVAIAAEYAGSALSETTKRAYIRDWFYFADLSRHRG